MSSTTLLKLLQKAANELGIIAPTAVVNNPAQDTIQLFALINACGDELIRKFPWSALCKSYLFMTQYTTTAGTYSAGSPVITGIPSTTGLDTTYMVVGVGIPNATFIKSVDSASQVTLILPTNASATNGTIYFQKVQYPMPADYDYIIPRTQWDKSKRWEMLGPESPQQWEWIMSGFIATGPRVRWRLFGPMLQIWPGFSNAEQLGFEYRSNGWVTDASGNPKSDFSADTDTCIFKDRLIINMVKLKYFEAKGFDTTAQFRNWMTEYESDTAQDWSYANLSFAPKPGNVLIGWDNIPDSGYGTPQ